MTDIEATHEEDAWIKRFRRVCADMPESCWLFAADSALYVMRRGPRGEHAINGNPCTHEGGGVDQDYILVNIKVDADGGDW